LENEVNSSPAPAAVAFDPRRRIRELLAIPDRDRTDAEWDELNELEIQTAPGNRAGGQPPSSYSGKPQFQSKNRSKSKGQHKPGGGGGSGGSGGGARPPQARPNNQNKPRPAWSGFSGINPLSRGLPVALTFDPGQTADPPASLAPDTGWRTDLSGQNPLPAPGCRCQHQKDRWPALGNPLWDPATGVTPGQFAVIYDNDKVLGCGEIE